MDEKEFEDGKTGGQLGVLGVIIRECSDSVCKFNCTFGEDKEVEGGYEPTQCPYRRRK
jgi:hypothetical protein